MSCSALASFHQSTPFVYHPRRPEKSLLYQTIQKELESWLEMRSCEEMPVFIEKEFHSFLKCGILAYGFARAHCSGCGYDFLVAFSCKGRGFCPSCNTRRMVETAAHLVDHVFPKRPVRQWVLSLPKRLRYFLPSNPKYASSILRILINTIEKALFRKISNAPVQSRLGAVTFLQRFGSTLNLHFHFHSCVIDGLFDREGNFYSVGFFNSEEIKAVEKQVCKKVVRFFLRQGFLNGEEASDMLSWNYSGFSLDASVLIEAQDRDGLERLIRYCARPVFASSRLEKVGNRLKYVLSKANAKGEKVLFLKPSELLDRLAKLIPPPRHHRHLYHGVLASNSPLRSKMAMLAGEEPPVAGTQLKQLLLDVDGEKSKNLIVQDGPLLSFDIEEKKKRKVSFGWAKLIARIYEVSPLICPKCGEMMKIIAFIEDRPTIQKILTCLNEPIDPPPIASARGPPEMEFNYDQRCAYD